MSGPQLDCRVVVSTRLHGRSASEMGLLWPKERQDTRAFYDPPRCLLPPLLLAFHLLALGLRLAFSFSFPWRSRKCCHRGSAARVYDLLVGVLSYPLCPSGVSLHSPFSVLGFSVLDSLFLCHAHLADCQIKYLGSVRFHAFFMLCTRRRFHPSNSFLWVGFIWVGMGMGSVGGCVQ